MYAFQWVHYQHGIVYIHNRCALPIGYTFYVLLFPRCALPNGYTHDMFLYISPAVPRVHIQLYIRYIFSGVPYLMTCNYMCPQVYPTQWVYI